MPLALRARRWAALVAAVGALCAGQASAASADVPVPAGPPTGLSAGQDGSPDATAPRDAARTGSADLQRQVDALNREISRVGDRLAADAVAYQRAQDRFEALTGAQFTARDAAETSQQRSADARDSLEELARAAYKGGLPPVVSAFLSGDPGTVSQLSYVQRSIENVGAQRVGTTTELRTRQVGASQLLVRSDAQRRSAMAARHELDRQLAALTATADALTARLTATAQQLDAARTREQQQALAAARAAERQRLLAELAAAEARKAAAASVIGLPYLPGAPTGGGGCQLPTGLEANGFLSDSGLCPLSVGRGHRLRTDAAAAFDLMSAAYQAEMGTALCVTDSYRSYAEQVDVFARKPGLAATPGRSQHGWGLAVDFCGGIQAFGAPAHQWMQANAARFGWVHPAWAEPRGKRPEPWHWEFGRRS